MGNGDAVEVSSQRNIWSYRYILKDYRVGLSPPKNTSNQTHGLEHITPGDRGLE